MPDERLNCQDCGAEFVFNEAEQALFRDRGFTHSPKRCKECRARNRQSGRAGRGGRSGSSDRPHQRAAAEVPQHAPVSALARAPSSDGGRTATAPAPAPERMHHAAPAAAAPPRAARPRGPMHTATCSVCGVATEVPFVPDGVRPVYCLPCLKRQTR